MAQTQREGGASASAWIGVPTRTAPLGLCLAPGCSFAAGGQDSDAAHCCYRCQTLHQDPNAAVANGWRQAHGPYCTSKVGIASGKIAWACSDDNDRRCIRSRSDGRCCAPDLLYKSPRIKRRAVPSRREAEWIALKIISFAPKTKVAHGQATFLLEDLMDRYFYRKGFDEAAVLNAVRKHMFTQDQMLRFKIERDADGFFIHVVDAGGSNELWRDLKRRLEALTPLTHEATIVYHHPPTSYEQGVAPPLDMQGRASHS